MSAPFTNEEKAARFLKYTASLLWDSNPQYRFPEPLKDFDEMLFQFLDSEGGLDESLMRYPEYRWRAEEGFRKQQEYLQKIVVWTNKEAAAHGMNLDPLAQLIASFDQFVKSQNGQSPRTEQQAERRAKGETVSRPPSQSDIEAWNYRKNLGRARLGEEYTAESSGDQARFEQWKKKAIRQYIQTNERTLKNALGYYSRKGGTSFYLLDGDYVADGEIPTSRKSIEGMAYRKMKLKHSLDPLKPEDVSTFWTLTPSGHQAVLPSPILGWYIPYLTNEATHYGKFDYQMQEMNDLSRVRRSLLAERLNRALGFQDRWGEAFDDSFARLSWSQGPAFIRAFLSARRGSVGDLFGLYWKDQTAGFARNASSPSNLYWWFHSQSPAARRKRTELLKKASDAVMLYNDGHILWEFLKFIDELEPFIFGSSESHAVAASSHVDLRQSLVRRSEIEKAEDSPIYTLSEGALGKPIPTRFEVFDSPSHLKSLSQLSNENGVPAYTVEQRLVKSSASGVFPIPSEFDHELTRLEVHGADGKPLKLGEGYTLLFDPDFNAYALKGPEQLSFRATFQERTFPWNVPPELSAVLSHLDKSAIGALAKRLVKYGFGQKGKAMSKLAKQKGDVSLERLDEALLGGSVYTYPEDEMVAMKPKRVDDSHGSEAWLRDASRRLDVDGNFRVQCLQQNLFANEVHSRVLDGSGLPALRTAVRRVLVRPEGKMFLRKNISHARGYLFLAGSEARPVVSDTTPPGEEGASHEVGADLPDGNEDSLSRLGQLYRTVIDYSETALTTGEKNLSHNEPLSLFLRWANQLLQSENTKYATPAAEINRAEVDHLKGLFSRLVEEQESQPPKPVSRTTKLGHRKYEDPEIKRLMKEGFETLSDCLQEWSHLGKNTP